MPFKFLEKWFGKKQSNSQDLCGCFSTKKEKAEPARNVEVIHKKPRQYDEVDLKEDNIETNINNTPPTVEPPLHYVEVDIKPSGGASKIVEKKEPTTQYSTIDIQATQQRQLSNEN